MPYIALYRDGMWGINSPKGVDIHQLVTPVTHVSLIHRLYHGHDFIEFFAGTYEKEREC